MGVLLAWLLKPKVVLSVLATIAVLSFILWYGNKREATGFTKGSVSQLQTDKQQLDQLTSQYHDALANAQRTIDSSNAKVAALDSQLQGLQVQFLALASQRQQGQQQISKLPDSAVQGDLETKLGGSLADPTILRKADSIVTDYPIVLKQIDVLTAKVDGLDSKVKVLGDKEAAVEQQRDAAIQFGNQVVGFYVKAYNAAQIHHSKFIKIITFGLVHDRHLDLPSPTTLKP